MTVKFNKIQYILILVVILLSALPVASTNLAYGKTVSTNTGAWYLGFYYPTNLPNVVDNNFASFTGAAGGASKAISYLVFTQNTTYISIDLGASYDVKYIRYKFNYKRQGPTGASYSNINVSNDGATWTRVNMTTDPQLDLTLDVDGTANISSTIRYISSSIWSDPPDGNAVVTWYEIQAYDDYYIQEVPYIVSPSNNSNLYAERLNLSWNLSVMDNDANWQTSTSPDFSTIYLQGNVSYPINYTGLQSINGQTLWARVKNYKNNFSSNWSTPIIINNNTLIAPVNGSTISYPYPPSTHNTSFSWAMYGAPAWQIQVASDSNFNLIEADNTISSNSTNISLIGGTHFWRVRPYNSTSAVYGSWSSTNNFTIAETGLTGVTGIQGVIYELTNGVQVPLNEVTVFIYNSTWTSSMLTGSNGYYLFSGLENSSTYTLYATKQRYDNAPTIVVTTVNGSLVTRNMRMQLSQGIVIPSPVQYTTIAFKNILGMSYPGLHVTIYRDDDIIPISGMSDLITDTQGQVNFYAIKDTNHRVVVTGEVSDTFYIYGGSTDYYLYTVWGIPNTDRSEDIIFNLSVTSYNTTHANVTFLYADNISSTTIINFYVRNVTTNTTFSSSSATQSWLTNYTIPMSGVWYFGFNSTSTQYGFLKLDKVVDMGSANADVPMIQTGLDKGVLQWISISLIVFTSALFSYRSIKKGVIVLALAASGLWWLGMFEPVPGNVIASGIVIGVVFTIAVLINMRASEVKLNY